MYLRFVACLHADTAELSEFDIKLNLTTESQLKRLNLILVVYKTNWVSN